VIVPAIAGPTALVLGLIEARYGSIGLWPFLLCFAPQIATISLIGPNSMAMALQRYPHMAGTASSLMGVIGWHQRGIRRWSASWTAPSLINSRRWNRRRAASIAPSPGAGS
jgi:hypothetical protein